MEYQALARKYRPRNFASLMGQEHVSKALTNALRTERLHHAYLFSGTRGVGKTTIARILAKSLNCEQGVVAEPCGVCATCKEIDEGRFIDLIEVDAASKTKVEDTREMLDNVQYAPVRGRYKVYLIDEVHMLSGHSFNALLKTLEEPPEHVKFLLATTDPQKLPITVLSRCLQFNLRALSLEQISQQLTKVLTAEKIEFEADALFPIAQGADGSMRDALSLLDQAIAFADGKLTLAHIDSMLGNVPSHHIIGVLTALIDNNAQNIMHALDEILSMGMGVDNVLCELISVFQKIAMMQVLPPSATPSPSEHNTQYEQQLYQLAGKISAPDIQLYYQIALSGRSDLELSPFPQAALEMLLLRMLAFRPMMSGADDYLQIKNNHSVDNADDLTKKKHLNNELASQSKKIAATAVPKREAVIKETVKEPEIINRGVTERNAVKENDFTSFWNDCARRVDCGGIEKEILLHCCLLDKYQQGNVLVIKLGLDKDHQALLNSSIVERIEAKLKDYFISKNESINDLSAEITILSEHKVDQAITPKQTEKKVAIEKLQQATTSMNEDVNVKLLIEQFSGRIIPDSIRPLD
jgi:DNA polymerase-3 subunit gamma/tau